MKHPLSRPELAEPFRPFRPSTARPAPRRVASLTTAAALALSGLAIGNGTTTPTAIEVQLASSPPQTGGFGHAVALRGDRAAISAIGEGADFYGAVYAFERSGPDWTQMQRILSGDGTGAHYFGFAVDIDGDTLVATGAEGVFEEVLVYAFEYENGSWSRVLRRTLFGTEQFIALSSSIAISGDVFAVGAGFEDDLSDQGRVEVYRHDTNLDLWLLEETITAFDAQNSDLFGKSVSLDGDTLVVGGGSDAYVYDYVDATGDWSFTQQINVPTAMGLAHTFAESLELDQDRLVIGHPGDNDDGNRSGSAYVYERGAATFGIVAELRASDAGPERQFGTDVSVDGDAIVVATMNPRASYLFELDGGTWCETARLCNEYGWAVDVDGSRILEGGVEAPAGGGETGAALIHRFDAPIGTPYCVAGTNSAGLEARIQAIGNTTAADDELFLTVRDGVADRFGIFFYGPNQIQVPLQGGFLCAGMSQRVPPVVRLDACGATSRRLSLSSGPAATDITAQAPVQMNFQFWYRDAMGSSNLSDGVSVDFQ